MVMEWIKFSLRGPTVLDFCSYSYLKPGAADRGLADWSHIVVPALHEDWTRFAGPQWGGGFIKYRPSAVKSQLIGAGKSLVSDRSLSFMRDNLNTSDILWG